MKDVQRAGEETLAERSYRANLPLLGPRLGAKLREVRAAVEAGELERLPSGKYLADGVELEPDEVLVALKGRAGYEVAGDQDVLVALDTTLTPNLIAEGRARELVRRIQEMRKDAGFEIQDRIRVRGRADRTWSKVLEAFEPVICQETLAIELGAELKGRGHRWEGEIDGEPVVIEIERA
ncbi:MAG: hypothetical protein KGJ86_06610 [Chloroflexota bacterium]|nr:hypothetical protein [Chloroflexota bacterium]